MKELLELSALELSAAIRAGDVSVAEATQTALDVMAEREPSMSSSVNSEKAKGKSIGNASP